jgi:nucleoside-diphosphate-sugar epimerase
MEILITGGNGLLGRHLVRALQDRGDSVRVLLLPGEATCAGRRLSPRR